MADSVAIVQPASVASPLGVGVCTIDLAACTLPFKRVINDYRIAPIATRWTTYHSVWNCYLSKKKRRGGYLYKADEYEWELDYGCDIGSGNDL